MSYKNRILSGVLFFGFLVFLQTFLFPFLVPFQEKNSFLYDRLSRLDRNLYTDEEHSNTKAPIVFLGDSQILSGVNPVELERLLKRPIWFLPRPSEQPEGMFLRYKEYERIIRLKPALVIVNGSVFSLSDMDVASAHRSLVLNYDSFQSEIFFEPTFRNFYLKNLSSGLFYLLGRIFPFLRLNASMSTAIKIAGEGDEFSHSENKMENLISGNPFVKWVANQKRNQFLNSEYSKNKGYMDWARYTTYDGICVPNFHGQILPQNAELALQKTRSSSLKAWKELFRYLQSRGVKVLAISLPFRPDFDSRLAKLPQLSLWESILIEEEVPYWKLGSHHFQESDFGDYTHLNTCGMKKLVPVLSREVLNSISESPSK
ncbi:hypothetical protein JWG44_10870 [Leptospira sp. 201903071]|uniref:hypothetical protein n=1 Tax=Leptospira ainazelensis TaxID=2810034 RepID=UPI0019667CDC|nr:hypothetical protein [Leptospira ainazelensis]MBM9500748.1 hypothetical protein [Leptospira ainazelensis]